MCITVGQTIGIYHVDQVLLVWKRLNPNHHHYSFTSFFWVELKGDLANILSGSIEHNFLFDRLAKGHILFPPRLTTLG